MVRSAITQLHSIWTEVGYDKETQLAYTNAALDHIQELLTDMVSESEDKKRLLLEESKQLMQNTSILCKELKETIDASGYEKLPLFKLQQVLRRDMEKLLRIKEQRKTYLNELLTKEHEICKRLGVQPIEIESKIPTEEELDNFKLYINKQEAEKDRIESEFKNKYNTIIKIVQDLGISPSSHFEETVCNNPENFVLTPANMAMLKDFQEKLERQLNSAKEEIENKKEELLALWGTLDEPNDFCQAFLDNYPAYSQATLKAINAEIGRCKERAHIAKYVNRVRAELVNMWDLCKYGESQRNKFTAFYSRTYTKDLLTLHELEVDKVRKYYETNKVIFNLLEEREKLWTKMKELEHRANNPDRLNNRGGQLLAEEKERKVIQRKLPKIESQLHNLVEEYETRHGETFYVNGVSLEEFLAQSWANRDIEKESKKNARKEAKDKSAKKASVTKRTPTASTSRLLTPLCTSTKRKLIFGSTPNSSAKRRNVGNDKVRSVTYASKIRRSGKISRRALSENKKRRSDLRKSRSPSENAGTVDTTYGHFQAHLKEREECRSSLLTDHSLSAKCILKTPNRTQVKPVRKKLYNVNASSNTTSKLLQSTRNSPRSPRGVHNSKLATAPNVLPIIF
ncbi:protein regulator of cytokinesis 1-like isoform X2 [Polistes fuscatus]|nr:protein regulator of cytokinesis 1-like isoform X2 [Polistes fuscatus]XP_043488307.1 protein regulator of cytokinesis 1-like isoform X2 [Polistes fuscatus]XP_043488308.1 protein regulator of cytokinesis 1-like isoform X2 [Polistes fuscatus]XP_043488309.1 protein regulator of cytokinesis 1-like isoform X2 [Polistes fuscatus]